MNNNNQAFSYSNILVYPKPLPTLQPSNETDDNGLTKIERNTLRNAWRLLKPQQQRISRSIWIRFLSQHEVQIEVFRHTDGTLQLDVLHCHAQKVFQLIGDIIEKHLEEPHELRNKLEQHMPIHVKHQIYLEYMYQYVNEVFLGILACSALQNQKSATLSNALDKLLTVIINFNAFELQRKQTLSVKYSVVQQTYSLKERKKSYGSNP